MGRKWLFRNTVASFLSIVMVLTCLPFDLVAEASEYLGECCYCGGAVYEGWDCKCGMEGLHHCEEWDCYMENHCMNCGYGCGDEMSNLGGVDGGWCPIGGQGSHCMNCLLEEEGFKECPTCGEEFCPICQGINFEDYGCETCLGCMNCWHHCTECGVCDQEGDFCYECGMCLDCCLEQNLHCPNCYECFKDNEFCEICGYCDKCVDGWHCEQCGYCHDGDTDAICEICGYCTACPEFAHCPDCDRCFEDIDHCDICGRCIECCEADAFSMGCDCADWVCVEDTDFSEHMAEFHKDAAHTKKASNTWSFDKSNHWRACQRCSDPEHISDFGKHTYKENGMCSVCGYVNNGGYIILEQPKSVSVKTSASTAEVGPTDPRSMKKNTASFRVKAYCDNTKKASQMCYHWQITFDGGKNVYSFFDDREGDTAWGIHTDTLVYGIDTDLCKYTGNNFCAVRCHITDRPTDKASDPKFDVYTEWARITPLHNYELEQDGAAGHYWRCLGEECGQRKTLNKKTLFNHTYADWEKNDAGLYTYCTVCGYEKEVPEHTHYYDQTTIERYKTDLDDFVEEYADSKEGKYQYRSESNKNLYFGANRYYHWGTCGEYGCEHPVTEAHDWKYNQDVTDTPAIGNDPVIYRICKECGYEDTSSEDGTWTNSSHLIIYENCSGNKTIAKYNDIVTLSRIKIEGKKFDHWLIQYETGKVISGKKIRRTYIDSSKLDDPDSNYSDEEKTLIANDQFKVTMTDKNKWFATAVMVNCDHSNYTEEVGKCSVTCTRFGYSGDKVCNDCGKILEYGTQTLPLGHGELIPAEEDILMYKIKNGLLTDEVLRYPSGEPMYEVRMACEGDCQHKGYTGDMVCERCGEAVEHGKSIKGEHKLRTASTPRYSCKNHGGDATLLSWCTVPNCGYQHYTHLGQVHDPENVETINVITAGCTTKGYTGDLYCKECHKIFETGKEILPVGHRWTTTVITAATADSEGKIRKYCPYCKMEKILTTPKLETHLTFNFDTPSDYTAKTVNITGLDTTKFKVEPLEMFGIFFTDSTASQKVTSPFTIGNTYYVMLWVSGQNNNEITADATATINGQEYTVNSTMWGKYFVVPFTVRGKILVGDLNGDGKITVDDAIIAARLAAGYGDYADRYDSDVADMNRDSKVTVDDAIIIARYAANYGNYRDIYTNYI